MEQPIIHVPLLNDRQYQWRVKAEVNGVTGLFILDTGADVTLITPQFARQLGLSDDTKEVRYTGPGSHDGKIKFAQIDSLSLGQMNYLGFYAPIVSLDHINRALDTEFAGILGNNLLNKTACTIDWNRNLLTLEALSADPPANAIPINIRHNRIYLTVLLNGRETEFALDTGAFRSTLTRKEISWLHIPADHQSPVSLPQIDIRDARQRQQIEVHLDTLQLGPTIRSDYTILTWDHNALGMDLLRQNVLHIDTRRHWMTLTP